MFDLIWMPEARDAFKSLEKQAKKSEKNRQKKRKKKSSRQEGIFKQVIKTLKLLQANPRHPGLNTHSYTTFEHPWSNKEKVFEAYVQNKTPGAYRVFWCYGPGKQEITILAITPHP